MIPIVWLFHNLTKDVDEMFLTDPQLERAVQEALRMMQEHPVTRLTSEPPPPTWGQRKTAMPTAPATDAGQGNH
jgi:hypothetical protein